MFGFFKRKHAQLGTRIDLTHHIDAAKKYISAQTQAKHSLCDTGIKYSARNTGIKYSSRDYSDSLFDKAQAYLSATQRQPSFNEMILSEIEAQNIAPKEFYSRAGLDRKLFSAIKQGGRSYQPSRNTAIRCCFALRLPLERTEILLKAAGYALSDTKRQDLIIRYCIENKIWNLFDVDELLYALDESILFK